MRVAVSRLVSSNKKIASGVTCISSKDSLIMATNAMFEWMASEPPRRITALLVLKQSENASTVTFGLDSYIIPITPRGTLFLPIIKPFGRSFIESTSPIGSSNAATWRTPSAIPSIRSGVNCNRSKRDSGILFAFPLAISFAFASRICSVLSTRFLATVSRHAFFIGFDNLFSVLEASFASFPIISNSITLPLFYM